jgi:hypothetical protein
LELELPLAGPSPNMVRRCRERRHAEALVGSLRTDYSPDQSLEAQEVRSALYAAITTLPEKYRVPIVRYYIERQPARRLPLSCACRSEPFAHSFAADSNGFAGIRCSRG